MRVGGGGANLTNMASSLYKFLEEDGDEAIIGWLWKCLLLLIAGSSLFKIPYGKNNNGKLGGLFSVTISARLGWFVMELPALAVPLLLLLTIGGRHVGSFNPNIILLGMFIAHYTNR